MEVRINLSHDHGSQSGIGTFDHSLVNELRILRRLKHPHLVHFYGDVIDADAGKMVLIFEYEVSEASRERRSY